MKRVVWATYVLFYFVFTAPLFSQTTYHLHKETTQGFLNLRTIGPDAKSAVTQSANLKDSGLKFTYYFARFWSTPVGAGGVIPMGSPVTFNLWMDKTANFGEVYPVVSLKLANGDPNTGLTDLCSQYGFSTPLTTTPTKYTFTCQIYGVPVASVNSYRLDVGFWMFSGVGNHNTYVEVRYEGTSNANYDSTMVVPALLPPTITSLSPNSGWIGRMVTINGSQFGSTQGSSSVKFNGISAAVSSWSNSNITARVPSGTSNGPVIVTAAAVPSNAVTFNVVPAPPTLSEHIYLGNRLLAIERHPVERYRPRAIEAIDSPGISTITNAANAIDNDEDALTFAEMQLSHTSCCADYSWLILSDFPEPSGPIVSARIFVVTDFVHGSTSGVPAVLIAIRNCHTYNPASNVCGIQFSNNDLDNYFGTVDHPKAVHSATISAEYFPGGASLYVGFLQWATLFQNLVPPTKYRIYDCWIEYQYE
jgi:IPT/TIG domain-containing protein